MEKETKHDMSIVEEDELNEYLCEIEVDPLGMYKTIQSAIDEAEPKTRIIVKRGIYKENIRIFKKHSIEICSESATEPSIILSENGPCVKIWGLDEDQTVKLTHMRFINRGIREDPLKDLYDDPSDEGATKYEDSSRVNFNKEKSFIYQNASSIEQLEVNFIMETNIIDGILGDNRGEISAISILSGSVMIANCQISLSFLTTDTHKIIPGIFSENSIVFCESVFIKGNKEYLTVGVFSHNSNLKVHNCKVINHRGGGILCDLNERNKVTVHKTTLIDNTGCGILAVNKAKKSAMKEKRSGLKGVVEISLEDNLFESNQGVGMKIINCFNLTVIGNKLYGNLLTGAELVDCDGLVMLNEFIKNKGAGLLLESENETFDAKIFKNTFAENYQNGIVVKGSNNFANISQNEKISNNYLSGIHVCEKASPRIIGNQIFSNMHQGVLIVSDSHAEICDNKIYSNIKANIAFGGKLSENTKIIENEIHSSRSEGVFAINSKGGLIARNRIYDNSDGVVFVKCENVELSENDIYKNVRCGVIVSDESYPQMFTNQIYENHFLGLFIRDESGGVYERNILKKNISQLYLGKNCKRLLKSIQSSNTIEGRYDVASTCNIF